jgi:hypothetical protein
MDFEESDFRPLQEREDAVPIGEAVKLEHRGVTSQSAEQRQGPDRQRVFEFVPTILRDTICRKLADFGRLDLTEGIGDCHSRRTVKQCTGCRKHSVFFNRCETKFCPICAPRLARERRETVEWWTKQLTQPKHVVLTARNTETITKERVLAFKEAFQKLRRRKLTRNWLGGFYSLEVTNEGRGWHLHMHVLVNARFVPADQLAVEWGKLIGQDFAIVKVKDCRDRSYLGEVTKYAVKGTELAGWTGADIAALMDAFEGVRVFGVFGELFKKRAEFREFLEALQGELPRCECGCDKWRILGEDEFNWEEIEREILLGPRPPPSCGVNPPAVHPEFRL